MNRDALQQSYDVIRRGIGSAAPQCVVVLGSGWSQAFADANPVCAMPYTEIPLLASSSVQGHAGQLLLLEHGGSCSLLFCGRKHWYEGLGWEPVALPVFTAVKAGARAILLTNAAGGIRPDLSPGTAMIVNDHINLMGAAPLSGPHDPFWGPRFADMTRVYDPGLRESLAACLSGAGQTFTSGVYAAVHGPSYETPAEVRALRQLGADAVGMSTVPEALLAKSAGLRVAALSLITNSAAGLIPDASLAHDEVLQVARHALGRARRAIGAFLSGFAGPDAAQP